MRSPSPRSCVFLFGLFGFLASWNNLPLPSDNTNLALFAILNQDSTKWIWVLVICLGMILNESAVDTLQNGLVNLITTVCFSKNTTTLYIRILVFLLNIPCVLISLSGLTIISLFSLANLIATTSCFPIILGLSDKLKVYHNEFSVLIGCSSSIFSVIVYGVLIQGNMKDGLTYVFYDCFCYEPFLVALLVSIIGTFLAMGINYILILNGMIVVPPTSTSSYTILDEDPMYSDISSRNESHPLTQSKYKEVN